MNRIYIPKFELKMSVYQRLLRFVFLCLWWLISQSAQAKTDTLRVKKDSVIVLKPEHIIRGETKIHLPMVQSHVQQTLKKQAALYKVGSTRSFAGLNSLPTLPVNQQDNLVAWQQLRYQAMVKDSSIRGKINEIEAIYKKITQESRFVKLITGGEQLQFPIGLLPSKAFDNGKKEDYMIALHGIRYRKGYSAIQVSMKLPIPEQQVGPAEVRALYFWGEVRLSQDGGFKGGKIGLLADMDINFGNYAITFEKSTLGSVQPDGTFISFDCNGFKAMGVKGAVIFSRNVLVPEKGNGERDTTPENRVKGRFNAIVGGWNDILLEVDMSQRFQATNLPRFGFRAKKVVLDLSDERNAAGQIFPQGYTENYLPDGNSEVWRGLSIGEFTMWLPKEFKRASANNSTTQSSNNRIVIQARNALIDRQGFTGEIEARNIIEPGQGKMGKWPFSVEHLYIKMEATQLRAGTFAGRVRLPITKEDPSAYLKYSVVIDPAYGEYIASVKFTKKMNMNLWAAKMEVQPSSVLQIGVKDGAFLAKVVLNGKFTDIGGEKFSKTLQMKDITFERMTIKTTPPYLTVGAMSFGGINQTQKLGGFTFTIDRIGFVQGEAERVGSNGLQVHGKVNFVEGANSFGAEAFGTIYGRLEDTPLGFQIPKFEHVELSEAGIDVDMGAFKLAGYVKYYKAHPVYGHGFKGEIQAAFGKSKMRINVKANAMFGNTRGFNYWYADALMAFKPGIPLVANGVKLAGFGGGAYYHMTRALKNNFANELGRTPSGISYEPDKETFLGIKASVLLTGPSASTYNGEAGFEIAFNRNGGIRKIGFDASLVIAAPGFKVNLGIMEKVTSELTKLEEAARKGAGKNGQKMLDLMTGRSKDDATPGYRGSGNGAIKAVARIDFDVANSVLHANLTVDIDVAGGIVRGGGEAVFHFAPDTWYVHIGTPQRRMGLNIMNIIQTGAYFMVGDNIPEMPPPPENVIRILGLQNEYNTQRDDAAMLAGKGLAFGADFRMDTGNMNFLMFYARFAAGLGFDVMLKKYADGISCKGRGGKGIGVNNWYAQGQVYAFFEGEIGIRVSLPFKKGNFPIIQGELAALMQAQLPNPVWIRGIVGGQFSILGGLVKGRCRFEVEIGERCEFVGGNALSGVEIISDVKPEEGKPEVGVFTSPQATFNLAVDRPFEIRDLVDDKMKKYRVKLDYFKVVERTSGRTIAGKMEWNEDHTVLSFVPKDILPSEKVLHAEIQVSFEESQSGRWKPVSGVVEKKALDFKTGKAPDKIVRQNIAYSYPVMKQLHFHTKENPQGYIQLKQGRPDLFDNPEVQKNFTQVVRFTDASNPRSKKEVPLTYEAASNRLVFNFPQNLGKQVTYHWEVVNVPKGQSNKVDENVTNITTNNPSNSDISVTKKKLEGTRTVYKEKKVFEAAVRTSLYETMAAKFDALSRTSGWSWPIMTSVHVLGSTFTGKETFDRFEVLGEGENPALIEMEAVMENTPWYQNTIAPLVYNHPGIRSLKRSKEPFGIPPFKALFINQDNWNNALSEETMAPEKPLVYRGAFILNVAPIVQRDFMEMVYKAAETKLRSERPIPWVERLMATPFPSIASGPYEVIIRYRLPGSGKVTFERRFTIINP
ncbi:hypothetical protein BKI52_19300 [marine bacterium AO1-C]|nr:hypothetical protein BKI52_19300 [marine bacterium AO1-C]